MTTQTSRFRPLPFPALARASVLARDAQARRTRARARGLARARAPVLATALWGALVLGTDASQARTPHAHKAASAPSTEQILAPSAATVPDALPPERQVWRCGDSYSAHPCAHAAARPLDVADARSEAQRRQSETLTARDKRLADWYAAGRRERDKAASSPSTDRRTAASPACVDTTMMHCVPKKPRARKVTLPAAASAVLAGKSKN